MNNYLIKTIAIAEFIFLLPVIIAGLVVNIFKHFILGQKVYEDKNLYKTSNYTLSLVVWLIIGGWIFYQWGFKTIYYVYACPSEQGSKCYKVRAEYVPASCEDVGLCTNSYIEKIYFNNGGYVTFDYCDTESEDKWTCYEEGDDRIWKIEMSERVKVKK